jgi:hypothetical protein
MLSRLRTGNKDFVLSLIVVPDAGDDHGLFVSTVKTFSTGRLGHVQGRNVVFGHPSIDFLVHEMDSINIRFSDKCLDFHAGLSFRRIVVVQCFEQCLTHSIAWGGQIRPRFKLEDGLVEKHLDAQDSCCTSFLCCPDELRFERAIDHVEDRVVGPEVVGGNGGLLRVVGVHAHRRAVDDDVVIFDCGFEVGGEIPTLDIAVTVFLEVVSEGRDLARGAPEDGDQFGVRVGRERERDGTDSATGAEEEDFLVVERDVRLFESTEGSGAVRGGPTELAVRVGDGIDGADVLGHRVDFVEVRDDRCFVRDGDAHPAKGGHGAHPCERAREIFDIEGEVNVILVGGVKGGIVNCRGEGVADGVSDDRAELGTGVDALHVD